jgi:phytoene dehydrogenase-like protein
VNNDGVSHSSFDESTDVVVMGSGMGGLSAAAKLAREGVGVTLLEQHNMPGGFATSFRRGRFEFEASLHILTDYGPAENKGFVRKFFEDELNLGLPMIRVDQGYHLILSDEGIDVDVPFDMDGFIDVVASEVPGSFKPLRQYMNLCLEIGRAIDYIAEADGNPDPMVLLKNHKSLLATAGYTAKEVTDRFHIPPKAVSILGVFWPYIGIPFDRMSFTIWATAINSVLTRGCYYPPINSFQISTALDKKIRELGGRTYYSTRVEKILVDRGKVIGVETNGGRRIRADWVISNASPTTVYGRLIHPAHAVPRAAKRLTAARKNGISLFVVYMGLDRPAHELGLTHHEYYLGPDMDTQKAYDIGDTLVPHIATSALCPNHVVPGVSPPGTCELILNQSYGADVWGQVSPDDYFETKRRFARAAVGHVERTIGTSLFDHMEEIESAAPQTFCRYTGSHKGVVYGYEHDVWDSVIPRALSLPLEGYIKGLEFVGGHGLLVQGYSAAISTGRLSALTVMGKMKKKSRFTA